MALTAAFLAATAFSQTPVQPPPLKSAPQDQKIHGKIVGLQGPDRVTVRTADNKEILLYANPQTRFVINGKVGAWADLRTGTDIQAVYVPRDGRFVVNTFTVGTLPAGEPGRAVVDVPQSPTLSVRGRIVATRAPDQVTVKTNDGHELTFFAATESRILVNGQPARFEDMRLGTEVTVAYRCVINSVTIEGPPPAVQPPPPAAVGEGTLIQGTVIRTVGTDQVLVRTPENKEIPVYVAPTTKYVFADQPGRFTDFIPGSEVRIYYDVNDRRNIARSITGHLRKK